MFEYPSSQFCEQDQVAYRILLPQADFYESIYLCRGMGGVPAVPSSYTEAKMMFRSGFEEENNCSIFWIGLWDKKEEGNWVGFSPTMGNTFPWSPDEPNGLHFENCGALDLAGIADDNCAAKR